MERFREREALRRANPSRKWLLKVNRMEDDQVHTIYKRLKLQGKV